MIKTFLIGLFAWPLPGTAADVGTLPVAAGAGETLNIIDGTTGTLASGPAIAATGGGIVTGANVKGTVTVGAMPVVSAEGAGSAITLTGPDTAITAGSGTTGDHVVFAGNGGRITLEGVVNASQNPAGTQHALHAAGGDSRITMNNGTINARYIGAGMENGGWVDLSGSNTINLTGRDDGSIGVRVVNSASPSGSAMSGLTININGDAPRTTDMAWMGVLVQESGSGASFDHLTVGGTGANVGGMAANGAALTVGNSAITVNGSINGDSLRIWPIGRDFVGQKAMGLISYSNSAVTIVDTDITVNTSADASHQGDSYGVYAVTNSTLDISGGSVTLTGNGHSPTGDHNVGIFVSDGSGGVVRGTEVRTFGSNSVGIWSAKSSTLLATGAAVTTRGNGSYAMRVEMGAEAVLERGTLRSEGDDSFGVFAADSSLFTGNGLTISTRGAYSVAVYVDENSTVDLTGGTIDATGSGNQGVWLSEVSPRLLMTGVSLRSSGVGAFIDGSDATLNMAGGSFVSSGTAFAVDGPGSVLDIGSGALVRAENNLLLYVVSGGSTTLSAGGGSNLFGDARSADPGGAAVNLGSQAAWTGAAHNIGPLSMTGGSLWNLTADSDVASFLLDNSAVAFRAPAGGGFKTLTVGGDYQGRNALISLNTFLGDDSSPSDMLTVGGNTSGQTRLRIANAGGSGALTTGNGIEVVDVAGTSAGEFALADRVIGGGVYEYRLYRGIAPGTEGNWYLRSTLLSPNPGSGALPDIRLPDVRPEVPLAGVIPPMASEYGFAMIDNLHKRVGELFPPGAEYAGGNRRPAAWARLLGGRGYDNHGGFMANGPRYDYTFKGIQVGVDYLATQRADGGADNAGLYFGYGRMSSDVAGAWSGKAGNADLNGYSLGVYWTHRGAEPWYTDVVLQGTLYRTDARSIYGERIKTHGRGMLASMEGGYAFQLIPGLILEPQAQIVWQTVSMKGTHDRFGIFSYDRGNSLRGRLGARLVKSWETGAGAERRHASTWLRGNVWHEFLGKHDYQAAAREGDSPVSFRSSSGGTWGEVELGVAGQVAKNVTLFATGSYSHSLDGEGRRGWDGRLGVSILW